jgi:hypothetical protein
LIKAIDTPPGMPLKSLAALYSSVISDQILLIHKGDPILLSREEGEGIWLDFTGGRRSRRRRRERKGAVALSEV